jgi:hypothetical protein
VASRRRVSQPSGSHIGSRLGCDLPPSMVPTAMLVHRPLLASLAGRIDSPLPASGKKPGVRGSVFVDRWDGDGLRRWRAIAQRALQPEAVVMLSPPLDQHFGLQQRVENLPVKQLILQLGGERPVIKP